MKTEFPLWGNKSKKKLYNHAQSKAPSKHRDKIDNCENSITNEASIFLQRSKRGILASIVTTGPPITAFIGSYFHTYFTPREFCFAARMHRKWLEHGKVSFICRAEDARLLQLLPNIHGQDVRQLIVERLWRVTVCRIRPSFQVVSYHHG